MLLACTKMSAPPSSGLMNPNPRCSSQAQRSLSIPWQKPPSKRSRQILLPHNASRSDVRPEEFERRAAPGQRNRPRSRSEEHTSELQSRQYLVCRLLLENKQTLSTAVTL